MNKYSTSKPDRVLGFLFFVFTCHICNMCAETFSVFWGQDVTHHTSGWTSHVRNPLENVLYVTINHLRYDRTPLLSRVCIYSQKRMLWSHALDNRTFTTQFFSILSLPLWQIIRQYSIKMYTGKPYYVPKRVPDYAGLNWHMTKTSQPGGNSCTCWGYRERKESGCIKEEG